jgi:hypothetical protein
MRNFSSREAVTKPFIDHVLKHGRIDIWKKSENTEMHKIALLHEIALPPKFLIGDDYQFFSMAMPRNEM